MEGLTSVSGERKRARSLSSSSSSSGLSAPGSPLSPIGSPVSLAFHHHLNSLPLPPSTSKPNKGKDKENSDRPVAKYHRAPSPDRSFLCTLPPTCSQPGSSQTFASQAELDAHQFRLHRWMCRIPIRDKPGRIGEGEDVLVPEQFAGRGPHGPHGQGTRWRECGKVFPEERLLDLHYTETHDPIAREKLQRGEKIFECFLPLEQCRKVFLTPKKRRHHLIDQHRYPVGYFFSITNHGLNQIVRVEGPAMSLIRPRRDYVTPTDGTAPIPTSPRQARRDSVGHHGHGHPPVTRNQHHEPPHPADDMDIDDLTSKMSSLESSLTFVPRNVRRTAARGRETRSAMEV